MAQVQEVSQVEKEKTNFAKMSFIELKRIAAKMAIRTGDLDGGDKERLVKRIILKKFGQSKKYIPGLTACQVCGEEVRVKGQSRDVEDGQMIVTRTVKCTGKHAHTYPLKEIYKPTETKQEEKKN